MKRWMLMATLAMALPLAAQETLVERLRAHLREAAAERDSPVLQRLEEAAEDVNDLALRVERHVDATVDFVRAIGPCDPESSAEIPPETTPLEELEQIPGEVDKAFDELDASREAAHALLTPQSPERFRSALRNAIAVADDMLAHRRDQSKAAQWLKRFADERRRSTSHQDLCRLFDSVAPLPEPFTMEQLRRDPLVPLRRIDEAVRRQVLRRNNALQRGEWSLGLGIEWTPLKANENGHEETRAGQPIAMIGFRPLPEDLPILRDSAIRPWFQIGAGLQFDDPSFYVGGAIEAGPYVLVGVGWTAQQVEDANGDEEFDGDVYVSMTVRLERLRRWMHE